MPAKKSSGRGTFMNLYMLNVGKRYIHVKVSEQTVDSENVGEK